MGIWCAQGTLRLTSGRSVGPHSVEKGCGPHCGPWGRAVRGIPIGFRLSWTPQDCEETALDIRCKKHMQDKTRYRAHLDGVGSGVSDACREKRVSIANVAQYNSQNTLTRYLEQVLRSGCTHLHVRHMQCDAQQSSMQIAAMGASTTDHASGAAPNVLSADDDTTQRNESLQKCMRAP